MSSDPAFARRLNDAFTDLLQRRGVRKISAREIGEDVARIAHRPTAFTHVAVAGWFEGAKPRLTSEQAALALYLGVAVSWLVYGIPVTGEVRGDESPAEAQPESPDSPIPPGHTKDNPYRVPRPQPTRKQGNGY